MTRDAERGAFEAVLSDKQCARTKCEERDREEEAPEEASSDAEPVDVEGVIVVTAVPVQPRDPPRTLPSALPSAERVVEVSITDRREASALLQALGDAVGQERGKSPLETGYMQYARMDPVDGSHATAAMARDAGLARLALPTKDGDTKVRPTDTEVQRATATLAGTARAHEQPRAQIEPGEAPAGQPEVAAEVRGRVEVATGSQQDTTSSDSDATPDRQGSAEDPAASLDVRALATSGREGADVGKVASTPGPRVANDAAREAVDRVVAHVRGLRESAGGREVSFEVGGRDDAHHVRVRVALGDADRTIRIAFDAKDSGVGHALEARVESLRARLKECGFEGTEVSFQGWDARGASGREFDDRRDRSAPTPADADDAPGGSPGVAPSTAEGTTRAASPTPVHPHGGMLSLVA